jgi:hypothetical protein
MPNAEDYPTSGRPTGQSYLREKRKWQIALRRYVLEKQKSTYYAPYFALDIGKIRQWIGLQFTHELKWDNFSKAWQFDHVVPVSYFDFNNDQDLKLCWNFTNIRVQPLQDGQSRRHGADLLSAKTYFQSLHQQSGYALCEMMVKKIEEVENADLAENGLLIRFLADNKVYLDATAAFNEEDFLQLNAGKSIRSIIYEKEFLKKFGS